jgi:hypothetical protein
VADRSRAKLLQEHIASRRAFGAYLGVSAAVRRADIERTRDFLTEIRARLTEAKRRQRSR